jgi:hypothetical protein
MKILNKECIKNIFFYIFSKVIKTRPKINLTETEMTRAKELIMNSIKNNMNKSKLEIIFQNEFKKDKKISYKTLKKYGIFLVYFLSIKINFNYF